jgi:lysophospholipase L1-like esterase
MRWFRVIAGLLLLAGRLLGQNTQLGRSPNDKFITAFWAQQGNATNAVAGLNANHGTNQWAVSLIPTALPSRTLETPAITGGSLTNTAIGLIDAHNHAAVWDSNGGLSYSTVSNTELNALIGITDNIQTLLDGRTGETNGVAYGLTLGGTTGVAGPLSANGATISTNELSYLAGAASNLQAQIDAIVSASGKLDSTNGAARASLSLLPFGVAPNTNVVLVAPYDTARLDAAYGPSTGQTYTEFLTSADRYRIRQTGDIVRFKLYVASISRLATLKFRVWRTNGVNFDWVGDSEDFASAATAGSVNTFTPATAIAAKTGDYVSVAVTYSGAGANAALFSSVAKNDYRYASPCSVYSVTSAPSTNGFAWTSQTALADRAVPVEVYMAAPVFVTMGDSIGSGRGSIQASFAEGRGHILPWKPGQTFDDLLSASTGWSHQNMAISSETSAQILARWAADVTALYPKFVVIDAGINDLSTGVATATTITNLGSMVAAAVAAGIKPVVLSVTPFSLGVTNSTAIAGRLTINASLAANVATWGGIYVPLDDVLGVYDPAGSAGNRDALDYALQGSEQDGVHMGVAGYQRMTREIFKALAPAEFYGSVNAGSLSSAGPLRLGNGSPGLVHVGRNPIQNANGQDLVIEAGGASAQATNGVGGTLRLRGGGSTGSGSSAVVVELPETGSSGVVSQERETVATFGSTQSRLAKPLVVGAADSANAGLTVKTSPSAGSTGYGLYSTPTVAAAINQFSSIYVAPTLTTSPTFYWGMWIPATASATVNNFGIEVDQPTSGSTRNAAITVGVPAIGTWAYYSTSSSPSYLTGAFSTGGTFGAAGVSTLTGDVGIGGAPTANAGLHLRAVPDTDAVGAAYGAYLGSTVSGHDYQFSSLYIDPAITVSPTFHWGIQIPAETGALTNNIGIQVDQPTTGATRNAALSIGLPAVGTWAIYSGSSSASSLAGALSVGGTLGATGVSTLTGDVGIGGAPTANAGLHLRAVPDTDAVGAAYGAYLGSTVSGHDYQFSSLYIDPVVTVSPTFHWGIQIPAETGALTNNIGLQIDQPTTGATRNAALSIGLPAVGTWAIYSGSSSASSLAGALSVGGALSGASLTGTGLTSGRVPYVSTGGLLADAAAFTYSAGNLTATSFTGALTSATGLPISTGVSGLGTGVATALAVNVGSAGAPVVNGGALGTPSSGTLTSATGLPISTGVAGLGTGVATALAVNVGSAGAPVLFNGAGGTPSSLALANATGLPLTTGVTGTLPVANGGSGAATLTGILKGNGTSSFTAVTAPSGTLVGTSDTQTLSAKTTSESAALGTDDTFEGNQLTGLNNSGGVTQWDAVYLNGSSQWVLADANGSGTYPARGLVSATASTGNASSVITRGTVRNDAWSWTPGGQLYLSTTAGSLTQTAPSTSGDKVQQIGFALTADIIFVDFASGEYLTVE